MKTKNAMPTTKAAAKKDIKEHKRLVGVLKHPTKAGLKSEVKEQTADLKEARKIEKKGKAK